MAFGFRGVLRDIPLPVLLPAVFSDASAAGYWYEE